MMLLPWQRLSKVTTQTFTVPLVPLGGMWNLKVSLERSNTGALKRNIHAQIYSIIYLNLHTFCEILKHKNTESHSLEIQSSSPWKWILVTDSRFLPLSKTLFLPWKETLLGSRERISGSYRTQRVAHRKRKIKKSISTQYDHSRFNDQQRLKVTFMIKNI